MKLIRRFFKLIWYLSLVIQVLLVVIFFGFYQRFVDEPVISVPPEVQEAADKLPEELGTPKIARQAVLVLPLAKDGEGVFVQGLRNSLDDHGEYRSVDEKKLRKILRDLRDDLGIQNKTVTDPDKAIKLGKAAEAELVIIGRVDEWTLDKDSWQVAFTASAYQVEDGKPVFVETRFTNAPPEPVGEPARWKSIKLPDLRLLAGLACFALFWPILLAPLTRKTLDRESNALTALMLVGVIAVPVAASWYSLMDGSAGVLRIVMLLCITVIVAIWSLFVMNQVAAEQAA